METTRLVIFDETTLSDFHGLILPNVLQELYSLDDFEKYGILALGAARGDAFVGAVIAQVLSEVKLKILSIYVAPAYRRQKIGSLLLEGMVSMGYELFDSDEQFEVPVGLCIDYALPDALCADFSAFLRAAGFGQSEERSALYAFPASCAAQLTADEAAHELPEAMYDAVSDVMDDYELSGVPSRCVYAGTEDNAHCMLLALDCDEAAYDLFSYAEDDCTEKEFEAALKLLLEKLEPGATVYADSLRNICPQVLQRTAELNGQRIRHCYAERRLIIEKGAEA